MKKACSPEGEGSFHNHRAWILLFYKGVRDPSCPPPRARLYRTVSHLEISAPKASLLL